MTTNLTRAIFARLRALLILGQRQSRPHHQLTLAIWMQTKENVKPRFQSTFTTDTQANVRSLLMVVSCWLFRSGLDGIMISRVWHIEGCGGNNNRFETLDECNHKCGYKPPKCLLPKSPGMCMAFFPRYYYDQTSMRCERFVYGGCQANANNFETIQECIKDCSDMSVYDINRK